MIKRLLAVVALAAFSCPALADGPATPGQSTILGTVNRSITITTGNTFQSILTALTNTAFPGTPARRALTIQNNNTNNDNCWIFIGSGSATKAASILLGPGGSYQRYWPFVPSDAVQATCASNGDSIYIETQ